MMKRHPSLQPLSREHHRALLYWRELDQQLGSPRSAGLRTAASSLQQYWNPRFASHMADEEHVLLGALPGAMRSRLLDEHGLLRLLLCSLNDRLDPGGPLALDDLASLAATLRAHIRWEERVLFPYLQCHVPADELRSWGDRLRGRRASDEASCDLR